MTYIYPITSSGSGSVTSVGLDLPDSLFSVSGSPVTTLGTLTGTLLDQASGVVLVGPASGADASPTFRPLVSSDLPLSPVTPGSYTSTNLTVDAQGRITAAADGSGGGSAVFEGGSVTVATTTNLTSSPTYYNGPGNDGIGATLTASDNSDLVVDTYTVLIRDSVLVKNERGGMPPMTNPTQGIYIMTQDTASNTQPWILTRATNFNTPDQINSSGEITIIGGSANQYTGWTVNEPITTIGTDIIYFGKTSGQPVTVTPTGSIGNYNIQITADGIIADYVSNDPFVSPITGSGGGTLYFSMPEQLTGYKKAVLVFSAFIDGGGAMITFPTAFTYTPDYINGAGAASVVPSALSTTSITLPTIASPVTGTMLIEGI